MKCPAYIEEVSGCSIFTDPCPYNGTPNLTYCQLHKMTLDDINKALDNIKNLREYMLSKEGTVW